MRNYWCLTGRFLGVRKGKGARYREPEWIISAANSTIPGYILAAGNKVEIVALGKCAIITADGNHYVWSTKDLRVCLARIHADDGIHVVTSDAALAAVCSSDSRVGAAIEAASFFDWYKATVEAIREARVDGHFPELAIACIDYCDGGVSFVRRFDSAGEHSSIPRRIAELEHGGAGDPSV